MKVKKICKHCEKPLSDFEIGWNRKYHGRCADRVTKIKQRTYKKEWRKSLGDRCIFCESLDIEIHHSDMNRSNNTKENLIPLCRKCHVRVHFKIIKPFIRKITNSLKDERYSVIDIAKLIGLSRQRIYKILSKK